MNLEAGSAWELMFPRPPLAGTACLLGRLTGGSSEHAAKASVVLGALPRGCGHWPLPSKLLGPH